MMDILSIMIIVFILLMIPVFTKSHRLNIWNNKVKNWEENLKQNEINRLKCKSEYYKNKYEENIMPRKYITDERFTRQKLHPHQEHYPLLLEARNKAEEHLKDILLPQHRRGCTLTISVQTIDIVLSRGTKDWYLSDVFNRKYKTAPLIELFIPKDNLQHIQRRRLL